MNQFDSAQLYATGTDICGKCGMHTENSDGCCHDELKVVKLTQDHNVSQLAFDIKAPAVEPANYNDLFADLNIRVVQKTDYLNHSPPLLSDQDIYIQNCVFRI
jgi:hypothetical protein